MDFNNDPNNSKWYEKVVEKFKTYQKKVGELEESVHDVRERYQEVVARNKYLENEIIKRTAELERTQKSLLSLQHIWDAMRSAEPLGNVLSIVSNTLVENLEYDFCCVMKLSDHKDDTLLQTRSYTDNDFLAKLDDAFNKSLTALSIPATTQDNPLVEAIERNEIITVSSFHQLLLGCTPDVSPQSITKLDNILEERAVVIVPLETVDSRFGALYGISQKSEILESEKNFLRLFADQIELAVTITKLFEQIREQAITDSLTKLANRRHFDQMLVQEAERSKRLKQPFSLIAIDMDHLKLINDTHGHSAGDMAIIHVADVLKKNARSIDLAARFGGEEFAVLLPGIDIDGALIAAERIREAIEETPVEGVGTVTASLGISTYLRHTEDLGELLELADQAMYDAKQKGRNQVCEAQSSLQEISWQELALETFIKILTQKHSPITPEIAQDLIKQLKEATHEQDGFVDILYNTVDCLIASIDCSHKKGYTENLSTYAVKLAYKAGLAPQQVDKVRLASMLHDLGKINLPQSIISKPGPLTEDEWRIVLQHPQIASKKLLGEIKNLNEVLPYIEHHHEHWDGNGYPDNLKEEEIPIGSRIILIADSYCAMTSNKPYRKAMTKEKVIETFRKGAGITWDPHLIEIFISILKEENDV